VLLEDLIDNKKMERLEIINILNLVVKTLRELENISIDENLKEQLISKVLEAGDIEKSKTIKRTPGSQKKVIESLRKLGGRVIRADIAADSGLDPNLVSSYLNKLVKSGQVEKIPLDKTTYCQWERIKP
jgi:hypothetical protein